MEKGFYRDEQGNLCYKGKYDYSLLVGKTDKDYTSDIVFIFREPTNKEIDEGFTGAVINFLYGGFDNLGNIEELILDYEKKTI